MKKFRGIPVVLLYFLSDIFAVTDTGDTCLRFIFPGKYTVIQNPLCTLTLSPCSLVQSVSFKAQFISDTGTQPTLITIGTLSEPPFRMLWDISQIPNQLLYGITCFAEAEFPRKATRLIKQEGVFLIHNRFEPPVCEVPFHGDSSAPVSNVFQLTSPGELSDGQVTTFWNDKEIAFHIEVNNKFFLNSVPISTLNKLGVRICLDPLNLRTPYLSENILILMIPVTNMCYQIVASPQYTSEGTYVIEEIHKDIRYASTVTTENFKGFVIDISIPLDAIRSTVPGTIGCNIIATVLDESLGIKELSWVRGNHFTTNAPFAYGKLILLEKPLLANDLLQWFIFFGIGLCVSLALLLLVAIIQRITSGKRKVYSEYERQLIQSICNLVDAEITNADFDITDSALKMNISPKRINSLIKKCFGLPFDKHLQQARVEIVKERLRSSNASEISIAKSCGFPSVEEMERQFKIVTNTTPYKYREEYRVS